VRSWPMIPGIDFAGVRTDTGARVVLNGWGVGEPPRRVGAEGACRRVVGELPTRSRRCRLRPSARRATRRCLCVLARGPFASRLPRAEARHRAGGSG
jgi:hypothetical protein